MAKVWRLISPSEPNKVSTWERETTGWNGQTSSIDIERMLKNGSAGVSREDRPIACLLNLQAGFLNIVEASGRRS